MEPDKFAQRFFIASFFYGSLGYAQSIVRVHIGHVEVGLQ
jgi:hypothetical protein